MTGDRPTTPGWHCHRCRSTSCRQRADSDTDHVGRVEYRPLLLTQPSSVSWLWSHTHWCPSQRPQEVMRVDGSANPTMPKNPAQYNSRPSSSYGIVSGSRGSRCITVCHRPPRPYATYTRHPTPRSLIAAARCAHERRHAVGRVRRLLWCATARPSAGRPAQTAALTRTGR